MKAKTASLLRQLPSVDAVLREMPSLAQSFGHRRVADTARAELARLRGQISAGIFPSAAAGAFTAHLVQAVEKSLAANPPTAMRPVFNLSGTILHTNLGRALLPEQALRAVHEAGGEAVNLEYDLISGQRGERDSHVQDLICELTGAEAATVVNNNAAALLLALNTLAQGREVPVSRGELVEIGDSFRLPEIMACSGASLVETGATNRTHVKDYEEAINHETALLLKVHASNYRIQGFASEVGIRELAELARRHELPLIFDMGSGNLVDLPALGLPAEPTAAEAIAKGVDVLAFSGDKLLGGPQCGVLAGRRELIEKMCRNPLKRALRVDKMTLAALAEVLRMYRNPARLGESLPVLRIMRRTAEDIRRQAERLLPVLRSSLGDDFRVALVPCRSQVGSGAMPLEGIASFALALSSKRERDEDIRRLARNLRQWPVPVIGRIRNRQLLLDLRCLEKEAEFVEQLRKMGASPQ